MKTLYKLKYIILFCLITLSFQETMAVKWVVQVSNFVFTPSNLPNVNVGDTVRWVWVSGNHTTTSSNIPTGAASWDHLINSGNQFFEYKVTVAGNYDYVCTPHAGMGMTGSFTASGSLPTLTVSPSNQNVPASMGTTNFNVTSNSSWTASSNAGWCAVTPSGSGNGTLSADYTQNISLSPRVATITVTVSGIPSQTVTVSQAGAAPTLNVSPSNQTVDYTAGNTSFTVTSNTSWTTTRDASWCTATPSGSGNGTIAVTYEENPTNAVRIANITVTVSGLPPTVVTVTQDGSTVSVKENSSVNMMVYPNPSAGIFKVNIDNGASVTGYEVINLTGKSIQLQNSMTQNQFNIDLTTQPEGCYFLRVNSDKGTILKKLILKK